MHLQSKNFFEIYISLYLQKALIAINALVRI